jgi:cell division protein FtsQ
VALFDSIRQQIAERPWRAGLYAFLAVTTAGAGLLAVDYLLRPDYFPVRNVRFEGEFRNVDEQVLASAVVDVVRGNFFLLDLDAVRARAQGVPWVYTVSVRREWPDSVYVRFTEQEIVAQWGAKGWINTQGEYVDLRGQTGPEGLPRLDGPAGMTARVLAHYRKLNALLADAGLQIRSLVLTARHSWNVTLDSGLQLTLGREEPEPKIERFARVYAASLGARAGQVKRVDLRYTNGFAVEWSNRVAPPRAAGMITTGSSEG